MTIVSDSAFHWILTVLTGGLAGAWLVYDARNLVKLRRGDAGDPLVRDRRFGYVIGIAIAVIGIVGVLSFHGVL
jgi:hypothetical protein